MPSGAVNSSFDTLTVMAKQSKKRTSMNQTNGVERIKFGMKKNRNED